MVFIYPLSLPVWLYHNNAGGSEGASPTNDLSPKSHLNGSNPHSIVTGLKPIKPPEISHGQTDVTVHPCFLRKSKTLSAIGLFS